MMKPLKLSKPFYLLLFLLLVFQGYSQNISTINTLPESAIGEWYSDSGTGEYNGLLIHSDFIEYGYRAFMYQEIIEISDTSFSFSAKDILGNNLNCELNILSKDSIQLKRGDMPLMTYVSRTEPKDSERTTFTEVPQIIKKKWYTTDGKSNFEFDITNEQFSFRGKVYEIDEIVNFKSNGKDEYRFIVKHDKECWMFYFKNWSEDYLQVGFHGKMGDLYKANTEYPDYRIDDVSGYMASIVPKEIRGNWLKADGSNTWAFSFYYDNAVLDKAIWNYKSVKQKGKLYVITLERNGTEKIIYAKLNKDKRVSFGTNKKSLVTYSTIAINNPNFKLANDAIYKEENLFKADSATYSGIIRGFNKQSKEKTGMVHVDNVFTGVQESYLVKIKDDGSFLVKFPMYYPQQVFVRFPSYNGSVFVEPGKETWQLINSSKSDQVLFLGDCAQLNTDFKNLEFISRDRSFYTDVVRYVDELSLDAYKKECFSFYNSQIKKRNSLYKTLSVSNKARQVFDLELEYRLYVNLLSYDIYSKDRNSSKIDRAYISFITPEIYNNELAVLTSGYSSVINRLKYLKHMRKGVSVTHPNVIELAEILKSENITLSEEEEELVTFYKRYNEENAIALKKQKDFSEKNQDVLNSVGRKIGSIYQKLNEGERKEIFDSGVLNLDSISAYLKSKNFDVTFSEEEIEVRKAGEKVLTKEEKESIATIHSPENSTRNREFSKKHKTQVDAYVNNERKRKQIEQTRKNIGNNFSADVMIAQDILSSISRNFIPLTDVELSASQKHVEHPVIANVFKVENDAMKAKIETNRLKTDFVLNETPKTEADKVFDAIISKYKGKVVYVDFWATWCGPCRSGMKRMKPLKEDMKGKDIAFVYITNPSSPETTYNNMIPDIKGEHYRVSKDEWNYLGSKFNITGIPHYLLVDKKGKVVKDNTSDLRMPETVKSLFEEYLNKK